MKYIYKNSIVILAGLLSLITFNACSDDEPVDEWAANYVYLQKEDYLLPDKMFTLVHSPLGVEGAEVTETFVVKIKRSVAKDVSVTLEIQSPDVPTDLISLSSKEVIIKAGEQTSEPITISISDWSFAQQDHDAKFYNLNVKISKIHNGEKDLRISSLHAAGTIKAEKSEYALITTVKPDTWTVIERTGWSVQASGVYYGMEEYYGPKMVIDGDMESAWYADEVEGSWWSTTLDTPAKLSGFSIGMGVNMAGVNLQYKKAGDTEWTTITTDYNFSAFKTNPVQYGFFESVIENVKEIRVNVVPVTGKFVYYTGFAEFDLYQ